MRAPGEKRPTFRCRDRWMGGDLPWIMGIVNVTPDSFSDGGQFDDPARARQHIARLLEEGADLIDLGGESTRPGSEPISVGEELRRVLPALEAALELGAIVSVDTQKPDVARAALERGAHLINDVGGMPDEMLSVVAEFGASAVAMHMQGTPRTMQQRPQYDDALGQVRDFLAERAEAAAAAGVPLLLDPGIGFGKSLEHNLRLLAHLDALRRLGPVLLGASRKSFLAKLTQRTVEQRLAGSLSVGLWGAAQGVQVLRVHDVRAHVDGRAVWNALRAARRAHRGAANRARLDGAGGDVPAFEPSSAENRTVIFIDDLELHCHIGVPDDERAAPQPVRCSVRLAPSGPLTAASPSRLREAGSETVDYAAVIAEVRRVAQSRPRQLLETLARELEEALRRKFPNWWVAVAVDKPRIAAELGAARIGVRTEAPR